MRLDIKPSFLESALLQEMSVRRGIIKMIQAAGMLSMGELLNHQGVHLEKLTGLKAPDDSPLYSLRVTHAARALAMVKGDLLVLLYVEPDHAKVYH